MLQVTHKSFLCWLDVYVKSQTLFDVQMACCVIDFGTGPMRIHRIYKCVKCNAYEDWIHYSPHMRLTLGSGNSIITHTQTHTHTHTHTQTHTHVHTDRHTHTHYSVFFPTMIPRLQVGPTRGIFLLEKIQIGNIKQCVILYIINVCEYYVRTYAKFFFPSL